MAERPPPTTPATPNTPPLPTLALLAEVDRTTLDDQYCVAAERKCIGCGYNLRTLHVTARCPECNRYVSDSLRQTTLAHADATWVNDIADGALVLTVAYSAFAVLIVICLVGGPTGALEALVMRLPAFLMPFWVTPLVAVLVIAPLLIVRGTAAILTREPGVSGHRRSPQAIARWLVKLTLLALIPAVLLGFAFNSGIPLACVVAAAVATLLIAARRAGHLLERAECPAGHIRGTLVAAGLGVTFGIDVLAAFVTLPPTPLSRQWIMWWLFALHGTAAGLCAWLYHALWHACRRARVERAARLAQTEQNDA